MDVPAKSAARSLDDLLIVLICVPVNILLARYVGLWLGWAGSAGILLGAFVPLAALSGRVVLRRGLSNLLLAITVMNFNAWAFSHVANLPTYLGLFFFMLFGLILGATVFRLLATFGAATPLRRQSAVVFVVLPWLGGLAMEAQYFPNDVYHACVEKQRLRRPAGAGEANPLKTHIPQQARDYLRASYSPNLTVGYWRWALQNGKIDILLPDTGKTFTYVLRQRGSGLVIRLASSLVMLGYGVFSQVAKLGIRGVMNDQNRAPS